MNKKLIFSLLLVVCLLAVVSVVVFAQSSPNVRWEYSSFNNSLIDRPAIDELNRLGKEGWELVTVSVVAQGRLAGSLVYYLKRPLP
jgi:hypothetical protein